MVSTDRMCSTQARRRAGLRSFPGGLLQDRLVEREVGDGFAQALVLGLQRLHALDLIGLGPAVLLAPAIIRDLGDADRADRVRHRGSLRNQDIDLAQLRNDLFGGVSLLTHSDPPSALTSHTSGWTTPTGADQCGTQRAVVRRLQRGSSS